MVLTVKTECFEKCNRDPKCYAVTYEKPLNEFDLVVCYLYKIEQYGIVPDSRWVSLFKKS